MPLLLLICRLCFCYNYSWICKQPCFCSLFFIIYFHCLFVRKFTINSITCHFRVIIYPSPSQHITSFPLITVINININYLSFSHRQKLLSNLPWLQGTHSLTAPPLCFKMKVSIVNNNVVSQMQGSKYNICL